MMNPILFDLDGTLLDLAFDELIWNHHLPALHAQTHGFTLQQSLQFLKAFHLRYQHTLAWYSSAHWSKQVGVDVLQLQKKHQDRICPRPGCIDLLTQLQAVGYSCWLVTNADCASLELKLEKVPLRPYFDVIISSEQIGYAKETLAFWQALQQRHHFIPERAVFIDDTASVLHSARQFGINQLITILQPSSLQASRLQSELDYPAIDHLTELFPFISAICYKEINVETA